MVCVQSSWFVGEADIARIVLCEHDIPCHIENEHFHMWHWLYASISGGFKVLVPRQHADEAARVLTSAKDEAPAETAPPWQCPDCGREIDADWDVCWFCTTPRDGSDPSVSEPQCDSASLAADFNAQSELAQRRAAAVVLPLAVLFWMTGGSLGALLIGSGAALVWFCLGDKRRPPSADAPGRDVLELERESLAQPLTPPEQSYRRRMRMGNRVVERALRAAVFGIGWFPPLSILAASLLLRLDWRKTPPGPWHRRQARLAWCLCAGGLALLLLYFFSLAEASLDATGIMGRWQ